MGVLHVLGPEGDITLAWDPADKESTAKAQEEWKRLRADGYEMFEVVDAKGKRIERFNKKLGKIIASPGAKRPADRRSGTRPRAMAGGPNDAVADYSRRHASVG